MTAQIDLELGEDERAVRDAASGALAKVLPHRALTTAADGDDAPVRAHWDLATAMGWTGLLVPEAQGGSGLGIREAAVIAEQLGYGLFCGPFVATAVLAPTLLAAAGGGGDARELLARIADGTAAIGLAAAGESGARNTDGAAPSIRANRQAVRRELVEYPGIATHFLVFDAMRVGADVVELAVTIVPAGPDCRIVPCQAFDVTCPVARVEFAAPASLADLRLDFRLSRSEFDALLRPFHVVVAAELVGVAQAALDRAVEHAKNREQFGVKIGSFQAIKHRLADVFMLVENARLAVRHAALAADDATSALIARMLAAEAAIKAAGDCIQIQGGMGFSWENDAHLYLKRARRLAATFGSPQEFRARIAESFVEAILGAAADG